MFRTLAVALLLTPFALSGADPPAVFPRFRVQEIENTLTVGYAVVVADINGDGKPDIVVVDSNRVLWYENPTWKRHTIITGKTKPDNVCIAAMDVDHDGKMDLVLGADWHPANTHGGGTLQWLRRGKTLDDEWQVFTIGEEPTVHRVRIADLDGSGQPSIVLAPLQGRDSTAKGNWLDGRPVRILRYKIPADPVKGPWVPEVINQSLHVVHNIWPIVGGGRGMDLLAASYEGITLIRRDDGGHWTESRLVPGDQSHPNGHRGCSEVKMGRLHDRPYLATIEPWHGNQVVAYSAGRNDRFPTHHHVLDDRLKWGHAVWCADLDLDGEQELVAGVRDDLSQKPGERRGVRIYKATDSKGETWARHLIDEGGVAVEDLTVADLNGDGRPEIIAVGRGTHNCRIYWNLGR